MTEKASNISFLIDFIAHLTNKFDVQNNRQALGLSFTNGFRHDLAGLPGRNHRPDADLRRFTRSLTGSPK